MIVWTHERDKERRWQWKQNMLIDTEGRVLEDEKEWMRGGVEREERRVQERNDKEIEEYLWQQLLTGVAWWLVRRPCVCMGLMAYRQSRPKFGLTILNWRTSRRACAPSWGKQVKPRDDRPDPYDLSLHHPLFYSLILMGMIILPLHITIKPILWLAT